MQHRLYMGAMLCTSGDGITRQRPAQGGDGSGVYPPTDRH
jgi:hypothetical protein